MMLTGNTTITVETEEGTTTYTSPMGPWAAMHYLADQWETAGWRYSIRHRDDNTITLTRYNDDGTINERVTLAEEVA